MLAAGWPVVAVLTAGWQGATLRRSSRGGTAGPTPRIQADPSGPSSALHDGNVRRPRAQAQGRLESRQWPARPLPGGRLLSELCSRPRGRLEGVDALADLARTGNRLVPPRTASYLLLPPRVTSTASYRPECQLLLGRPAVEYGCLVWPNKARGALQSRRGEGIACSARLGRTEYEGGTVKPVLVSRSRLPTCTQGCSRPGMGPQPRARLVAASYGCSLLWLQPPMVAASALLLRTHEKSAVSARDVKPTSLARSSTSLSSTPAAQEDAGGGRPAFGAAGARRRSIG